MSSYKPPHSRMRQIRAAAPPPIPSHPQNVEEAIEAVAAKQAAGEEVAEEIRVPVGAVDAVVTPGEDGVFGTADDETRIEAHKDDGEHEHVEPEADPEEPLVADPEPEAVADPEPEAEADPEPEAVVKPDYDMELKKADLVALADEHGVDSSGTKAQIIAALDAHFGE